MAEISLLNLNDLERCPICADQVKMREQPDAYEFSIKTPVTPARWEDYDTVCNPLMLHSTVI